VSSRNDHVIGLASKFGVFNWDQFVASGCNDSNFEINWFCEISNVALVGVGYLGNRSTKWNHPLGSKLRDRRTLVGWSKHHDSVKLVRPITQQGLADNDGTEAVCDEVHSGDFWIEIQLSQKPVESGGMSLDGKQRAAIVKKTSLKSCLTKPPTDWQHDSAIRRNSMDQYNDRLGSLLWHGNLPRTK
jgi:hypothetical protein